MCKCCSASPLGSWYITLTSTDGKTFLNKALLTLNPDNQATLVDGRFDAGDQGTEIFFGPFSTAVGPWKRNADGTISIKLLNFTGPNLVTHNKAELLNPVRFVVRADYTVSVCKGKMTGDIVLNKFPPGTEKDNSPATAEKAAISFPAAKVSDGVRISA